MNAVISLCHFCELHGPSILFCTQAFHPEEDSQQVFDKDGELEDKKDAGQSFLTPDGESAASAPPTPTSIPSKVEKCEACRSFMPGQTGYISTDHEAKVSYVSSQYPQHPQVFTMARQACVRSLSCEVCPGREGPIFFGDDHRGHVLSYTFFMKDSQARGFQHWYSIIVVMMDKIFLLNSWPFLVPQIETIIKRLQDSATKVYEEEQARCPQRAQRLTMSMNPSNFHQQRGGNKPARSFTELTNDANVFKKLHQSFTWLLKVGGNRLTERLFEGPPTEDSVIDLEKQEETEEGFVKLFSKKVNLDEEEAEGDTESSSDDDQTKINNVSTFINVRHLLRVLGYQKFHELAYHVITGDQVIVKGKHKLMVRSAINCLKTLLPKGCCRIIYYSSKYEDTWKCNFLGLKPAVIVPSHVKLFVILEMKDPEPVTNSGEMDYAVPPPTDANEFANYTFTIKTPLPMPEKEPVILRKMEFALMNENLADSVVEQCLVCLKEEWMNKVKVLFKFTKAGGNRSEEDTRKLMQVVGAQDEDRSVLKFWMTGLSVQYRNHTLSSAIQSVSF